MKKNTIYFLLILTASCSTYNNNNNNVKSKQYISLESKLNYLNYNLSLPLTWIPFLDIHRDISFKPIQENNTEVHLWKIPQSEDKNRTLLTVVEKIIKKRSGFLKMRSLKKELKQSKFGDTYIVDKSFKLNSKNYSTREIYFKYKEDYYCFRYTTDESMFYKYLNDSTLIFETLEFKE